jgi:hypothetical protein
MNRNTWLSIIVVVAIVGFWAAKRFLNKDSQRSQVTYAKAPGTGYWTCPMHPQIHLDHAGECPICHMKLVMVKAQEAQASQSTRSDVQGSSNQLNLIGVQRAQAELMDLNVKIPVAGNLVSSSNVSFQVYESDLGIVKKGLTFKGRSSFSPETEISGKITSVDSVIDPTSRTVRVMGRIDNGARGLVSETTFSGEIEVPLKGRVAIPESSVLHTGDGDLVYVFVDGSKLKPKKVMLGQKTEGFFEVVSGLEPGEFISSGPNFLIDSEAKIRGTSEGSKTGANAKTPECPANEHWDVPMAMCMPGKAAK